MKLIPRFAPVVLLSFLAAPLHADEGIEKLLPLPANVREIFNQSCVLCHGEVIDGKPEIREDLDLSTDEQLRQTLSSAETLRDVIITGEMPHDAKLSFRLRKQPEMQNRLKQLKADYDAQGSQQQLLAWLENVLGPAPENAGESRKKKD
ncbi:MAG: cytochrome c [Opitutus sp.]|nr:cytochrome c [Opitutus sp.]